MAARLNKRQATMVKDHIQTSQLVNRLQNHVLDGEQMTRSQIDAARILLKKTLPDLAVTQMTGKDDGPIQFERTVKLIG